MGDYKPGDCQICRKLETVWPLNDHLYKYRWKSSVKKFKEQKGGRLLLPGRAVSVAYWIADTFRDNGTGFCTSHQVADDLHVSTSTVDNGLNDLMAAGFLARWKQGQRKAFRSYGKWVALPGFHSDYRIRWPMDRGVRCVECDVILDDPLDNVEDRLCVDHDEEPSF